MVVAYLSLNQSVAPRAGAWVETSRLALLRSIIFVAPRAGAWVETHNRELVAAVKPSHPVRVRGLKRTPPPRHQRCLWVAPRAGAWVETGCINENQSGIMSHPVRVRGLKR